YQLQRMALIMENGICLTVERQTEPCEGGHFQKAFHVRWGFLDVFVVSKLTGTPPRDGGGGIGNLRQVDQ
ncbi:hypothetical protein KI387_015330, partial [Taxus chinensis]